MQLTQFREYRAGEEGDDVLVIHKFGTSNAVLAKTGMWLSKAWVNVMWLCQSVILVQDNTLHENTPLSPAVLPMILLMVLGQSDKQNQVQLQLGMGYGQVTQSFVILTLVFIW